MNTQVKETVKKITPSWMIRLARSIVTRYRYWKSQRYVGRLLETENNICLEIGAEKKRSGWHTLDINPYCDICWDLMKGLPFPDNSVQKIYSSHVLEHFSYSDLIKLLKECLRVLAPKGTFSVCIPDASIYISAYVNGRDLDPEQFPLYEVAFHGNSKIDYVNYIAYMDGHHKHMFDEDNILSILRNVGFSSCRSRDFDAALDLDERKHESIYAIAEK